MNEPTVFGSSRTTLFPAPTILLTAPNAFETPATWNAIVYLLPSSRWMYGRCIPRFGILCPPAAVYSTPALDAFVYNIFTFGNIPGGATESLAPESIKMDMAFQPSLCSIDTSHISYSSSNTIGWSIWSLTSSNVDCILSMSLLFLYLRNRHEFNVK